MDLRTCAIIARTPDGRSLAGCVAALGEQTHPVDEILVVDSLAGGSAGSPVEAAPPGVTLLAHEGDHGPAGRFHEGMKQAYEAGFDWLWLLDDDVVPEPAALASLFEASTAVPELPEPYLLASKVLAPDGRLHPDHVPFPDTKRVPHAVRSVSGGLLPLRASSFASVIISRAAVRDHGLPVKSYFDRSYAREYSARLLREGIGFVVPRSVARLERAPGAASRDDLYRDVRNTVFMMRGDAWMGREKVQLAIDLAPKARASGLRSAATIARGLADGLRRSP